MSTSIKLSPSETPGTPSKKVKTESQGTPRGKARIPAEYKIVIAEHIIMKGVNATDVGELAETVSSYRSDNVQHNVGLADMQGDRLV